MTSENQSGDMERLQALEQKMDQLDSTVRTLATTVARLVNADLTPDGGGSESADAVPSVELVRWVHWLTNRYEIHDIPRCWAHHGEFVEELDALRVGWLDTIGQGQGGLGAMQWHDLAARTFERFRRMARSCAGSTHRETELPDWWNDDPDDRPRPDLANRYEPASSNDSDGSAPR